MANTNTDDILLDTTLPCTLCGVPVSVAIQIDAVPIFRTSMCFTYLGRDVFFIIPCISGPDIQGLMRMVITQYPDDARFGSLAMPSIASAQAAVLQFIQDIMLALDRILTRYPQSTLDYASWYCENIKRSGAYPHQVTLNACLIMVQNNLVADNVHWDLVGFPGVEQYQ